MKREPTGQISASELAVHATGEIKRLHDQILRHARQSLNNAIRIGEVLTQVKAVLKHGQWLEWLESSAPFSERTAQNYMACYARRDAFKSANVADLTKAYGLILSSNGSHSREPQRLHESNFYSRSIKLTQALMGDINHELKDRPLESWPRDRLVSLAAAIEPIAELFGRIKALLE